MKANLAISVAALVFASLANAEIVEEETWYSAEGKVVKTVKRTLTGVDAQKSQAPDWEPAWVARERIRDGRIYGNYSSPLRYRRGSDRAGYYYPYSARYYVPRSYSYSWSGVRGRFRTGSGGTHWGVGYRRPGLNLFITR